MLYQFQTLDKKMDEWGFPVLKGKSGYQMIKGVDFEKAYKSGSISFEEDGIYLDYEGKKYRGYMFIKEPWIEKYNSYPKFHLTKCTTIQQFIAEGRFKLRYEWSNSNVNDLIDKSSRRIYKDEVLEYCNYCRHELYNGIEDTNDFYQIIKEETDDVEEVVPVDIFGYVKGKEKISKAFRLSRNFTCESCGIVLKGTFERRYLHVHHRNGDKTNNNEYNLQCLCILCHAHQDGTHEHNFNQNSQKIELDSFVTKYRSQLKEKNNRFLR